jgi:signal transduction histidine kinase
LSASREPDARSEHSLLSLVELSDALSLAKDVFEIAEIALVNLLGHLGCSRAALWLLSPSGRSAVLIKSHGIRRDIGRMLGVLWEERIRESAAGQGDAIVIDELPDDPVGAVSVARHHHLALVAPVRVRTNLIGFAAIGRRLNGVGYSPRDLQLIRVSLSSVAVAIENAKLYTHLLENNRQLQTANLRLTELDQIKSEFLCNLNHELRTPLTIMIGNLENLTSSEQGNTVRRQQIETVMDQAHKLQGMLLSLLDLSAAVHGQAVPKLESTDLRPVLEQYVESRRLGMATELRELRFECPPVLPAPVCDRHNVVQILDCLVDNAVKFTPPGSCVRVAAVVEESGADAKGQPGWLRIDVSDDGPGIPEALQSKIFDMFRQGDGSATRAMGGMGVGLSLARRLAELGNALLDVTSVVGQGTTFSLRLPLCASDAHAPTARS